MASPKSVQLEKIDENTYAPGKSGDIEQFLFCPHCDSTFTNGEMKEAYKEHVKLEAEIKVEKMLNEAFNKEFAEENSKFRRNFRLMFFAYFMFIFVFLILVLPLSWTSKGVLGFWLSSAFAGGFVIFVYIFLSIRKRGKAFEEFKTKYIEDR